RLARTLVAPEDRQHRPALVTREGARFDDPHAIADPALILLVVRLVAHALGQILAVLAVPHEAGDDHDDRLVHLVGHDDAFAFLPFAGDFLLRAGFLRALDVRPVLARFARGDLVVARRARVEDFFGCAGASAAAFAAPRGAASPRARARSTVF